MGTLNTLLVVVLLFGTRGFCQYEDYDYDSEYGPERDNDFHSPIQFTHNIDYGVPYVQYSTDCARECLCPPTFPMTIYCDHRRLKVIPQIPSRIQQLYLQFNDIDSVKAKSFINVTVLKEINLSHNKITSNKIEVGVFAKFPHLVQLYLHHNQLDEIPSPLPSSAERIFLNFNKITKVKEHDLQGLVNLTMLDLCNNHIEAIQGKTLARLKNLMQVNICNNNLKSLPATLPPSLMYLSLENNSISRIPEDYFTKLQNLIAIRMSHNNLEEVTMKAFNLPNLVELNLGHNKLQNVFYVPRSLEHLYLQDNEVEILNITVMCPVMDPIYPNRLTYLRVEQNKLKAPISTYAFLCFPHMQSIYYGEQKQDGGDNPQLRPPMFPQFPGPDEEEEEDEREAAGEYHGHWHEEEDNDFDDYTY
ncbi:osteomodulin [Bombina bombina]|uniref:osteomodulin n=1 Tax=Bombina bombina TaxID=8345 RepID=UPI00235AAB72|nr:osteomodulin [Bombina bombina]